MNEIILSANSRSVGKRIVELAIPPTINILAIKRADVYISPNGSTKLLANDILHVLAEDQSSLELFGEVLDIKIESK